MQRGLYGRLADAGGISQVLLWRADASVAGLLAVTVRIGLPVWAGSRVQLLSVSRVGPQPRSSGFCFSLTFGTVALDWVGIED